jgi:predicted enzyme related to lactoylglutathione lyase
MGDLRTYEPGTPSWVDLGSPDPAKAAEFYDALFGWQEVSQGPVEETGGYMMFHLVGKDVAGLGPGEHPAWTTYITVADVDAIAAVVEANGGTTIVPPMPVLTAGRMAVFTDGEGAPFAAWQPQDHQGAQRIHEPNTFTWAELACRDVDAAKAFYGAVFGWEGETHPFAETSSYTEFQLPGGAAPFAGMVQMNEVWPDDIPAHWMVYFAVDDTDACAARVATLGGTVSVGPFDMAQVGRVAVLNDPQGAVFSVIDRVDR